MKRTILILAFSIAGFLLVGDAYGEDEVYYCAEIGSGGFDYDDKLGAYKPSFNKEDRYKMKLDRASGILELAIDGLPPEAPVEFTNPKYYCRHRQNSPELLICESGLNHFDINIENGKFVRSQSTSIKFHKFGIYISYGTCDKF